MDWTGLELYVDSWWKKYFYGPKTNELTEKEIKIHFKMRKIRIFCPLPKLYFLSDPKTGGISTTDHPQTDPIAKDNAWSAS